MSKIQLSTFVNFHGRAREGLEFYQWVLGGKLDLQQLRLETDGAVILATDGNPAHPPTPGDNLALSAAGADKERLTKIFNELGAGGKIKMPLAKQPWGAEVGWLTDKFGVTWTVNIL